MNIKELSIGDWVMYRNRKWQVCSLYQFTGEVGLWRKDSQICENVADLTPIPLTPEILEKNGFEKLGLSERRWENEEMCIAAVRDTEGKYWVVCEADYNRIAPFDVNVYSVHELQHALRLAGIEKEIEL